MLIIYTDSENKKQVIDTPTITILTPTRKFKVTTRDDLFLTLENVPIAEKSSKKPIEVYKEPFKIQLR